MSKMVFTVTSENDTIKKSIEFAKLINYKGIILLSGELGAGKTTFCRGIIKSLKKNLIVNSPTFTLINEYCINTQKIYHIDLYRIEENSFSELPLNDIINEKHSLILIEWGEKILNYIKNYYLITFNFINTNQRSITIEKIDN